MSEQLIVTVILKLIDLGIRLSDKPGDVEEYARLRREVRKAAVAEANSPAEDDAPSHDDDGGAEEQDAQDEQTRTDAPASVEGDPHPREEGEQYDNQESDDDEAQASTQPE